MASNEEQNEEMIHTVKNVGLDEEHVIAPMGRMVKDMRLLYTNVVGILSKRLELLRLVNKEKTVSLTEVKLSKDYILKMRDCSIWRRDRMDGRRREVLIATQSGEEIMWLGQSRISDRESEK